MKKITPPPHKQTLYTLINSQLKIVLVFFFLFLFFSCQTETTNLSNPNNPTNIATYLKQNGFVEKIVSSKEAMDKKTPIVKTLEEAKALVNSLKNIKPSTIPNLSNDR